MGAPHFVCWLLFLVQLIQGQHEPYGSLHGPLTRPLSSLVSQLGTLGPYTVAVTVPVILILRQKDCSPVDRHWVQTKSKLWMELPKRLHCIRMHPALWRTHTYMLAYATRHPPTLHGVKRKLTSLKQCPKTSNQTSNYFLERNLAFLVSLPP